MKTGKRKSGSENGIDTPRKLTLARTLTLTATLAALGTSLGVDVKSLFAAEPRSEEGKLSFGVESGKMIADREGATQDKWKAPPPESVQAKAKKNPLPAVQAKAKKNPLPAVQHKMRGTPAARQSGDPHVERKAASGQGTLTQGVPPPGARQIKGDAITPAGQGAPVPQSLPGETIKGKAVPSQQMKFEGPPPGAAGTKDPGTGR